MDDILTIKDQIIEKGFPELSDIIIDVEYEKIKDAYFEYDRVRKHEYIISASHSIRELPLGALQGALAHELAHISRDYKKCWFFHEMDARLYSNISKYETHDERATDILVIDRGYGLQLLEFIRYHDKTHKKYDSSDGLTRKEIEKMLISRGEIRNPNTSP